MTRPSSKPANDHQNSHSNHHHATSILRQPIVSITGNTRDWVYLVLIVSATILLCYVANLIFQLLKPISDLISGTGTGIGIVCSRIGSGIEAGVGSVAAGFTGLVSTIIPPMVSFKCFLVNCDLVMPYLPDEESEELFFRTANLTARLKHEAKEILNLNGHIQSLSEGAVLDGINENSLIFRDLCLKTIFDTSLPLSLRLPISDRFASLANLSRMLERAFFALRRAGYNTKTTFLIEMGRLEDVLDPIWIFPTLSRDICLRQQLEKSQGSVDSTLDRLENAVDEAVNIAILLDRKLEEFDRFLRDQSNLLEANQTHVQWFLTVMGFSRLLRENREQMMFLTFNVLEARDHFMDVGTSCANIRKASEILKEQLSDISPSNVPTGHEDNSPVAVRKAVRMYVQKLGEAPG